MDDVIEQIARKAGVSEDVVLKVINNDIYVPYDQKKRVVDAISELNYNPESLNGDIGTRKTNTIAVITAYLNSFSFYEVYLINGFEKQNSDLGRKYILNQYSTGGNQQRKKELLKAILSESLADGVISMFLKFEQDDLNELKNKKIPAIFIDEEAEGFPSVKLNNFKGAYDAVKYLIDKGKRNIGLVVGQLSSEGVGITPIERFEGYKKALQDNKIAFDKDKVIEIINYTFEEGEQALLSYIDRKIKFDAIFCAAGDMVALGIMDEASKLNMDIPHDFALIGYDDISMASISKPGLTTVKQPIESIGRTALRMLDSMIETGKIEQSKIIFEPELVIRGTA
ncbi:MAG: LacI family DNA-binding transcriptional regulator [Candidatus Goldbacteria bacterium]|nr:LacI family DNA-binding transcriptional regulator [Candidatus Goldiibacteriota bacterium]